MKELTKVNLKKHAAAVHCSGQLSLVERKLSNILLMNAYDDLLKKDVHVIPTKHLFAMVGWEDSNNVEGLKSTLKGLMSTVVEFNLMANGGEMWHAMTLISSATIVDGECRYTYAKDLAVRFYNPDIFAVINIAVQRRFKSNYALTLYENCVRFIRVGSTGWWNLAMFKKLMGSTSETYNEFKRLSSFVIKPAIVEINKLSDIQITVEYKKEKRRVVELRFLVTPNPLKGLVENDTTAIQTTDLYDELKELELFKRLRAHGIGERLALIWMVKEPELAAKAVDYTEEMDSKGLIKGNTAGYIRKLIETQADLGQSKYEQKKKEIAAEDAQRIAEKNIQEYRKKRLAEFEKSLFQKALKELSPDQLLKLKDEFLISDYGRGLSLIEFDSKKGKFVDKVTQLTFFPWIKKNIIPSYTQEDFDKWLNQNV